MAEGGPGDSEPPKQRQARGSPPRGKKDGQRGMNEIAELERRIAAALERIGRGAERLTRQHARGTGAELDEARARLGAALGAAAELERRVAGLRSQVAAQAGEIQRLKSANAELAASLQALREAGESADGALLDRARAAELEAMRAARSAEVVEIEGLLAELRPLIGEAHHA